MDEENIAEQEFLDYHKKKRLSELEVINIIGKFSQKNIKFINDLKKENLFAGNDKKVKKNIIFAKEGLNSCTITFDYDKMDVTTAGDADFCNMLRRKIDL